MAPRDSWFKPRADNANPDRPGVAEGVAEGEEAGSRVATAQAPYDEEDPEAAKWEEVDRDFYRWEDLLVRTVFIVSSNWDSRHFPRSLQSDPPPVPCLLPAMAPQVRIKSELAASRRRGPLVVVPTVPGGGGAAAVAALQHSQQQQMLDHALKRQSGTGRANPLTNGGLRSSHTGPAGGAATKRGM